VKQHTWKNNVIHKIDADSKRQKRILLGQLNSNGDCLYATAIARQIKIDYPGCRLTWAIGSMCRSILDGNPYVDDVWEISLSSIDQVPEVWPRFEREALERKKNGDFDEIFLTQIAPGNLHNYDGTIRSSLFRGYPKPITVPITPILRLSPAEVEKVRFFVESNSLVDKSHVILFECSPKSAQSFITPAYAQTFAHKLISIFQDVSIILSSNIPIQSTDKRIIDGSVLTLRENAELTKYCSLLIGGSSGVSWIATTDWAKPLPNIQLITTDTMWFASFVHDHELYGLATDDIIEMSDCTIDNLLNCVADVFNKGFSAARLVFHERIPLPFNYFGAIQYHLLRAGNFQKAIKFLIINIQRHGLRSEFILWPFSLLFKSV
jgi:hypothetical protein